MAKIEEVTGEVNILEKLNKAMDELVAYRNVYTATIETANSRMEKIEKKLAEKTEMPKDVQVQIEKIEETIEKLSKNLNGLFEGHEKIESQIEKSRKEDLAYVKGLDTHLSSFVIETNDKLNEMDKKLTKTHAESELNNRFRTAFQNFIRSVMG